MSAINRIDRGGLVGGLLERERIGEGLVVARGVDERMAFARRTSRVEIEQFRGRIANLLRRLPARLLPLTGTQRMQRRIIVRGARVARDEMQLRDGDVELGLVRILEMQELHAAIAQVHHFQAEIASDAVLRVDHRIADAQLRQVAHHHLDVARAFLLAPADATTRRAASVEFVLREVNERRGVCREADVQYADAHGEGRARRDECCVRVEDIGEQIELRERLQQRLAAARRIGDDERRAVAAVEELPQARSRVRPPTIDRDVGCGTNAGVRGVGLVLGRCADRHATEALGLGEELFGVEEQAIGRQQRPLSVGREESMPLGGIALEVEQRLLDVAEQDYGRIGRQVVEERRGLVEEKRQVVLDAGARNAATDVAIDRRLGRIAFEGRAPAAAKRGACFLVHREFATRQQAHFLDRIQAALRVDVEGLDRFDLVAEEVEAIGHHRSHREEIDQPAAHAVLAGGHHLRHVLIAGQCELGAQSRFVERLALPEEERVGGKVRGWSESVRRGGCRRDQHVALAARDVMQRGQTFGHQVLMRRELVVRQCLPVGQQVNAELGREEAQLVVQSLRGGGLGAQHRLHAAIGRVARPLGDQPCVARAGNGREGQALAGTG